MDAARRLLREGRETEARRLLEQIDHQRARAWLARLQAHNGDSQLPSLSMRHTLTAALVVAFAVLACGLILWRLSVGG